jgi:hypothetical protein
MRHHRAQPADQRFEDRIQRERARTGDNQVDGQPPPPPKREDDRRGPDNGPQHAIAAQPGDRLDHRNDRGVARDQAVQADGGMVVGRLQRCPLQAYQDEQNREDNRRDGDRGQRHQTAP